MEHREYAFMFRVLPGEGRYVPRAVLGLCLLQTNMQRDPQEKVGSVTVESTRLVLNPARSLQSCVIILKLHPALSLLISEIKIGISPSQGPCV